MTTTIGHRPTRATHAGAWLCTALLLLVATPPCATAQTAGTAEPPLASAVPDTAGWHDPGYTSIMVLARADEDSVVLRWAPGTPHGWRVANRTGYVVERRGPDGEFVRLTPDTLHPWHALTFIDEMRRQPDHPWLGLVLNALWADSVLLEPGGADTTGENAIRNTNLFSYALFAADNDPVIAGAMGLRYVDRTVKPGERYTYRIRLNEPRDYRIDPGEVEVEVRAARTGPPPVNLTARGFDGRIELRWDPQPSDEYTGYIVQRSGNKGKTFTQMTRRPIVIVMTPDATIPAQGGFTDSTVTNYTVYVYRVHGITAFGERGAVAEVRAYARDLTPPPSPVMKNPEQAGRTMVQLAWEMPATVPDLAGFIVLRSAQPDSNYRELTGKPLGRAARQYTDRKADDAEPYYIVAAVDTAGNRAPSFPVFGALIDTMPPATPAGLRGTIDTNGVVHLTWNRNRERTILGYRVLRANAPDHEFTQLTGEVWKDTLYTDTIEVRTLTRNVYYRIAAVNARYNHSRPTAILTLRRPDMTPPIPPVFSDVRTGDSAVVLSWVPSPSPDVRSHVLSRRVPSVGGWLELAVLGRTAADHTDRAVQQNVMYEYRIDAVDSSGLRSPKGLTVQARPYDSGVRPTVDDLIASFDPASNAVALGWTYAAGTAEGMYFVVFRSRDGGPLARIRALGKDLRTFVDRDIPGPGIYAYAIKVMTDSGAESSLSGQAQVTVRQPGQ